MADKLKFGFYWAASCGGCEIAVLGLQEKLLDVAAAFEIVFWPCVMDFKYDDVRRMDDDWIDVCLFNGGIRSAENEEIAHLLRAKSKALVAFSVVNLAVIKSHLGQGQPRTGARLLQYGLLPLIGCGLIVWLWTSLSALTLGIGLAWFALGLAYLGVQDIIYIQ
mgnify:CR=1 FL=1